MPSEALTLEDIEKAKSRLEVAIKDKPASAILDLLSDLDKMNVTVAALSKTGIGKVVMSLKSHASSEIQKLALALVNKWAAMVKATPAKVAEKTAASVKPVTKPAASPTPAPRPVAKDLIAQMLMKVVRDAVGFLSSDDMNNLDAVAGTITSPTAGDGTPEAFEAVSTDPVGSEASNLVCKQTEDQVREQANAVAQAIHDALTEATKSDPKPAAAYGEQFRTITLNLPNNPTLALNVYNKVLPAEELVRMKSEEMLSDDSKRKMQEMLTKYRESVMLDWKSKNRAKILAAAGLDTMSSILVCKNCKSRNTEFSERQTRSADEPTTKFAFCHDCNARWKFC